MPLKCCVFGCSARAERDDVKFYKFPTIRKKNLHEISKRRQQAWLKAIGRKDLEKLNLMYMYVCEKHFINKKSANINDELNPDWVPSLNLGFVAPGQLQPASALRRYKRAVDRSSTKSELEQLAAVERDIISQNEALNTACAHLDGDAAPGNTCDQFPQTEDFYIAEGANEALLKKCQEQALHIERLKEENAALKDNNKKTTWNDLECNDKKVKYLTGFPNFQVMEIIYREVEDQLPFTKSGKISKFEIFMITFKKMRLDVPFSYMSYEYGVASLLFHKTIKIMYDKLCCFIFWPDKKASIINCPTIFQEYFGMKRVFIIDCFEVFCERPGNLLSRANTFSNYKHHQTLKYLIAITAYGAVAFISKTYGGRCSDKYVLETSGFLDKITQEDIILADRGFLIQASIAAKRAKLIMPAFKNMRTQLEPLEIENNRQIASLRIHVERVIGVLRQKFLILSNRQPITAISKKGFNNKMYIDYMMTIMCSIINLSPSIVNK